MLDDYKKLWKIIANHSYITICTHIEPDGDTLGSAVALKELIRINCPKVKEVKISGGDYPRNLLFLIDEPINLVENEYFNKSLKIVVDTSTKSRIYDSRVIPEQSLKIDHHPHENKWLFEIGGDNWPATGELLTLIIKALKLKTNGKVLNGLAVAIITDTEFFMERNINQETFKCMGFLMEKGLNYSQLIKNMKLNNLENKLIFDTIKDKQEYEGISYVISDSVITNDIVRPLVMKFVDSTTSEVAIAFLKKDDGKYRGEIRSKTHFDVSQVARKFGGGGHHNSSGFIIDNINDVQKVLDYTKSVLI
ncbi:DHH family phosphoesterase [Mycoplasma elephantis]|uniref:DHH family phosphoesterase n=1 Tax=Mycoplasma elephantis TaxID=114882 RepID=UPI000489CD40|nr:DHHA1 domain-containing protein [Mycoplasma elephantis]